MNTKRSINGVVVDPNNTGKKGKKKKVDIKSSFWETFWGIIGWIGFIYLGYKLYLFLFG